MGESGEEKAFSEMAGKNESGTPKFRRGRFVAVPAKANSAGGENKTAIKNADSRIQSHCSICMTRTNCQTVRAWTKLMNILIGRGKPQEAVSIFDKLIEGGHLPSLVTYTTLLVALTIQKRFESIHSIISQVEGRGMKPDVIFFNTVIEAFIEPGNIEEAMRTFWKMKESGLQPTFRTYKALIKGYRIAGKPEGSLKVLDLMYQKENVKPDLKDYNFIVKDYCNKKNMTEAWNVVHKMVALGMQPDAMTYNPLITAYARNGETDQAEQVISEIQKNNLGLNEQTCCTIISGYRKEGRMKDALRFVYRMKELGVNPNLIIFNSLIKGFVDITDRDGIDEVLRLMEEFRVEPDVITFSTIMDAWSQAGFLDKCEEIFDDMVKAGIQPDIHAYSILSKAYVRAQKPEKAEELLTTVLESGSHANIVIFRTVIWGWCSAGRVDDAIRIFDKMCECGITPNLETFETLIWGYSKAKQPRKAEETLQIMKQFRIQPKESTNLLVAEAWHTAGFINEANRILGTSSCKTETAKDRPVESLEEPYHKQTTGPSYSNHLQIPSGQKGSAPSLRRGRLVMRDAIFQQESSGLCTKFIYLSRSCIFGASYPIICQKQSQRQLHMYGQLSTSCAAVFLN
ncbi:hypothetical protein SLA2020_005550 [Shorea laevis]